MTITVRVGINGLPAIADTGSDSTLISVRVSIAGLSSGGTDPTDPTDPTPVDALPITLSSPQDQTVIPSHRPQFMVGVTSSELEAQYSVIIQYANNQAMTSPTTLTADFTTVDGGVVVDPTADVPDTTYWRARVAQGDTWRSAWTDIHSFTVGNIGTPGTLALTWHVDSTAARPIHLWHLSPPVADVGDAVTAYGQGFPDSGQGKVVFNDTICQVTRWVRTAATGADDTDRQINGTSVDPEHYEVDFVAPESDGPGGPLSVETTI